MCTLHAQLADDADNYLPKNDEQSKNDEQPKPLAKSTAVNPSRLEEGQLEDVTCDDKRALTPSSPLEFDVIEYILQ